MISARGIRTFAQGYMVVLLAFYFLELGYNVVELGLFISVGIAGVAFFAFFVGLISGKVGRRWLLVFFSLVSGAAGLALILSEEYLALLIVAFVGSLAAGGGGGGESPAQPLEIASLPDTTSNERRTDVFSVYTIVARSGTALGALAALLPTIFQEQLGLSPVSSYQVMFVVFSVLQLIGALLYSLLSSAVEGPPAQQQWSNPLKLPSRRRIFTLTGLFTVDTFSTSMVHQSLIAAWFIAKFDLKPWELGPVFFLSHVLTAISIGVAAKLANRIGLLNTMVFTHIPSSIFFVFAVFSPTAWLAILFWQVRAFLSQMDVATKDSYTMAVVGPEERVAMASIHMVSRSGAGAFGPWVSSTLWSALSASVPFVGSAILKISYDLSLYAIFRNVKPPEEVRREQLRSEAKRTAS